MPTRATVDAKKADGKKITVNWAFPDVKAKHALFLENSVLNHWADYEAKDADVTVTLDRAVLDQVLAKQLSFKDALAQGKVKLAGDAAKFEELMGMLVRRLGTVNTCVPDRNKHKQEECPHGLRTHSEKVRPHAI